MCATIDPGLKRIQVEIVGVILCIQQLAAFESMCHFSVGASEMNCSPVFIFYLHFHPAMS